MGEKFDFPLCRLLPNGRVSSEEFLFESRARYFQVARRDLIYLKFILEAYEGVAVLSTIERKGAIVRIGYPHFSTEDVDRLLQALGGEIDLQEVPQPEGFSDGLPPIPIRKVSEHA